MGMSDPKVVHRIVTLKPSKRLRRMAEAIHGKNFAMSIDSAIYDAKVVNAVAASLERAFEAGLTKDNRIDFKTAAVHMIKEMRENQF